MVDRKSSVIKAKEKELPKVAERRVDPKLKLNTLADAIVGGMLTVPLESELVVEKKTNERKRLLKLSQEPLSSTAEISPITPEVITGVN